MRIKLVIEYDGTGYCGWQRQDGDKTVQQTIEDALLNVTGEKTVLHAAGRTDAGVHALGQIAHFDTESHIPPDKFSFALNAKLPPDIRIKNSALVDGSFHARFNAKQKHYRYVMQNSPHASAVLRNQSMHVPIIMDIVKMRQAAAYLIGTHDFAAFKGTPCNVKTTVRTVYSIDIIPSDSLVQIDVIGNGFLYNMVRIMAGTLMLVGIGKLSPEEVLSILESKDRRQAGITAKPQGLFLVEVRYE